MSHSMSLVELVGQSGGGRLLGGNCLTGAVGGGVDVALPDLPDLVTRSCRVRHQNVTLDELGRMSVSEWGWAPPGGKLPNRNQFPNDFPFIARLIVCIEFLV
jgi:hypothetical protein